MRRFVGAAAVMALALGGVFLGASAGAAIPRFDAVGTVQCTMTGQYTTKPGILNTARSGVVQKFRAKLTCSSGTTGSSAVTVRVGHLTATSVAGTTACTTAAVPTMNATIKWTAKGGKVNPTHITWTDGVTATNPRVTKNFALAKATVTGSYAGSAARAYVVADRLGVDACSTRTGLKAFKFSGLGGQSTFEATASGSTTTTPPVPGTLLFADEFNGASLDTSKWVALDRTGDASNGEVQCYRPANVAVNGGMVTMTSKADTSCAGHSYTSGNIQWKTFNYLYGTIEIRAKLAGGSGTWPADWMLGQNCQASNIVSADNVSPCSWPNPGSEEIDIAEMWNDTKTAVRQNFLTSTGSRTCAASGLSDVSLNWHVYTLVWAPGSLVWKVDGTTQCSTTVAPSTPMFLTLNTAMGGAHGGTIVDSTLPQIHAIDYVRVYR